MHANGPAVPRSARNGLPRAAFTFVELLLVLFIALVTAGLTVPRFVRSAQSARLRASARTVVTAARLAQARAVLRQTTTALVLDTGRGTVEVAVWDDAQAGAASPEPGTDAGTPVAGPRIETARPLEEGVRFARAEARVAGQATNGVAWILYYPNGMCDGLEATLVDRQGREAEVRVERFAGRAEVTL